MMMIPAIECLESRELLVAGFTPAQLRHAYGVDQLPFTGAGETIGIIVAYHNQHLADDVAKIDAMNDLAPCDLRVSHVGLTQPDADSGWGLEESLDVEYAHAMAPLATIQVVEAPNASIPSLMFAAAYAEFLGAHIVSMSFGGPMMPFERGIDPLFNRAGYSCIAAAGDSPGSYFPSSSDYVTSVGGTTLTLDAAGNVVSETPWSQSGGGITTIEQTPTYQHGHGHGHRGRLTPDIAFVADPHPGVEVYDTDYGGVVRVGGTSVGAPCVAGIVALADEGRARAGESPLGPLNPALYRAPKSDFRPSLGLGSPRAERLVPDLIAYGSHATHHTGNSHR
jgi:subtilase family serine protease